MTRGAPALASHAAAAACCARHAAASCRLRELRRSVPHAHPSPGRRSVQPVVLPAAAAGRFMACTGTLEDIPDSEPMDAGTSPADIAVSTPPPRHSGRPRRNKFQVRIRITAAQQVGLDEFWKAQGVKKKEHRTRLVALAGGVLLFRSPVMIVERLQQLRTALWLAAGINNADVGAMVGRFPRLLAGDIPIAVPLKLSMLQEGMPGVDLKRLVEAVPQLLSLDPEVSVISRAYALLELMPRRDVLRMCEMHPQLLTVDTQRVVVPAFNALRSELASYGLRGMIATQVAEKTPRLLTTTPATIAARLALLERVSPGTILSLQKRPSALARLMCASERALMRIQFLHEVDPDVELSPLTAVCLNAAEFKRRYPQFESWSSSGGGTEEQSTAQ